MLCKREIAGQQSHGTVPVHALPSILTITSYWPGREAYAGVFNFWLRDRLDAPQHEEPSQQRRPLQRCATTSRTSRENRSCPHVAISLVNPSVCRQQRGETEPSAPCLPPVSTTAPHLSSSLPPPAKWERTWKLSRLRRRNFRASAAARCLRFAPPAARFFARPSRDCRPLGNLSGGRQQRDGTPPCLPLVSTTAPHLSSASRDEPLRCPPVGPEFARGFTRPPPTKPRGGDNGG